MTGSYGLENNGNLKIQFYNTRRERMITYENFWKTMARRKISQYCLIHTYGFSSGQLHRLKKNRPVSTHTLEMLCRYLDCHIEDIVEYVPDNQ